MNGPFVRRLHSLTLGLIARWSPADDPLHQAFDREIHANWTPQSSREVRSDVESDVVHLTSLLKDGPRSSLPTALAALPLVLASMVTFAVYPTPIVVKWDNSPLADLASGIDGLAVLALGLIVLWSPRVLPRRVTLGLFVLPTAVGAFLGAIADGPDALGGLGLLYLPIRLANAMAVVGLGWLLVSALRRTEDFDRGWRIFGLAMILFFFGNVAWAVVFLLEGDVAWCVGSFLWALATAIIGGNILDAPPKFTPRSQSRPKAITTV